MYMTVAERLERIHASIQVKLAQMGMPTDRETLEEVCTAIACLVRDPDSIELHTSAMSVEDYSIVADCLTLAARDFAEEITLLITLIATLDVRMQEEVEAWVESGLVSPSSAQHVIREMVLARFVAPEQELEDKPDAQDNPDYSA